MLGNICLNGSIPSSCHHMLISVMLLDPVMLVCWLSLAPWIGGYTMPLSYPSWLCAVWHIDIDLFSFRSDNVVDSSVVYFVLFCMLLDCTDVMFRKEFILIWRQMLHPDNHLVHRSHLRIITMDLNCNSCPNDVCKRSTYNTRMCPDVIIDGLHCSWNISLTDLRQYVLVLSIIFEPLLPKSKWTVSLCTPVIFPNEWCISAYDGRERKLASCLPELWLKPVALCEEFSWHSSHLDFHWYYQYSCWQGLVVCLNRLGHSLWWAVGLLWD